MKIKDLKMAVASVNINVNGIPIPSEFQLVWVSIHHELNQISKASLIFSSGVASSPFPISDSKIFTAGSVVEVRVGYNTNVGELIFSGIVVAQSAEIAQGSGAKLKVSCKHKAIITTLPKKTRVFTQLKDSEAWEMMMSENGIEYGIASSHRVHENLIQNDTTDWRFICSTAQRVGYNVICGLDNKINIHPPGLSAPIKQRLTYGANVLSFSANFDATDQLGAISFSGWDSANQELFTHDADSPQLVDFCASAELGNSKSLYLDGYEAFSSSVIGPMDAQLRADAAMLTMRLSALKGEVCFSGESSMMPGDLIELRGFGSLYSGKAFVTAVHQQISEGNWTTTAHFGLGNLIEEGKAQVREHIREESSDISGLRIAKILQFSKDPNGEFRVQVNVIGSGRDNIWARMSGFYASKNSGAFFMPEVGDEVVLGFLGANADLPVILGSLYSSYHPAPIEQREDNHQKAIITRSKLALSFDDDEKAIRISTPGGAVVELSDDKGYLKFADQNGNQITLGPQGIFITSKKGVTVSGPAGISADSDQGTITLKALNIEQSAQLSFNASGRAITKVSSEGQLDIQGSIVQIN